MEPFGFTGRSGNVFESRPVTGGPGENRMSHQDGFIPIPDRWRIGLPGNYVQNTRGSAIDPYHQNVLKGDYPIFGQDQFLIVTVTSDTIFEARKVYIPSGSFSNSANSLNFFGTGTQQSVVQNFIFSLDYFIGETSYKPRDIELKATMVANYNYVHGNETQILSPDPGDSTDREDGNIAFQELFAEKHLHDLSNNYDIIALRVGIQGFNSDFRGFLFNDNEPGVRLLGNLDNNQLIFNLAWFHQLEKDTNSGLNTFNQRDQDVFIANVYREDFIWKGYTAQLSANFNYDRSGKETYDNNGFLVRPAPIGTVADKEDRVFYFGWAGDGHIGPINITHQFYQAFGTESFNPIAGQETTVDARMFAIEASIDQDWKRYRTSFFYASGDHNATDKHATGFDSIFDNMNFAGGQFSYFGRQGLPLTGGGTGLKGRNSLYPDLRTSKEQGQANYVNPGLLLYNIGADFDVTPKLKVITNASYLMFDSVDSLNTLLYDGHISRSIGYDLSVGIQYRPLNSQNIILTGGVACLIPADGFIDIYRDGTLYSGFLSATLTY